ncbi:LuxR C-terminal-related transcriptional regulator [Acetobacterium woodii]|uniref:Transcriptional regulator LuxR family n=1 Tax=Acetobacterium woodii (strain ATCC 29683 / DSM 1030 / JCM 2381 / KCTC 1655 / WB1) TaxID=931626 RepID=H6LJJ2_ACEWD|nr:LuxR C-terminal-related transcriptional regulator [Acetobacterium woodii]AFA49920.1 transcriptional regulator LuxR family [Acetobacterium woodii DSM 1030]
MDYNQPFISVKHKMPVPRKHYIIRAQLFRQLENLEDYQVVIVKAGAGCGKTTLLSSFAIEQGIKNFKWITLDEHANQAFVFWKYLIDALSELLDEQTSLQNIFDNNMQKEILFQMIRYFLNHLKAEEEIVLVLDDFQIVADDFLISTIDYFIKNMPRQLHLVLLTREMPTLYLGQLAIENRLLLIEEDAIRLTEAESREFLEETLNLNKDETEIYSMIQRSEGWIGGLQLLAISKKYGNQSSIESMKLSDRLLNEYISKEIFGYLTDDEQNFLIKTAILRYFNGEICQQYLPQTPFIPMMEAILQKNLFVINIDDEAGIYRYHAIMAQYLKSLFEKQDQAIKSEYHLLAATIYDRLGDQEECLYHLFEIKAYEKIMKLILKMPQTTLTFSYLMKVPMVEIAKNPDFAYQYFFYYYASLDERACAEIYSFIKTNLKTEKSFEAFQKSNMFFSNEWDFRTSEILSLEEIKKLPLNPITIAFLLIKEAYFLYANGQFYQAIDYLEVAEAVYEKTGNIYIGFFVLTEKAQIYEDLGELNRCLELYKEVEKMVSQVNTLSCSYYIGIAGVYIRQLALEKASEMLEKTKKNINAESNSIFWAYQYTLAEYYYITGENDKTESILLAVMDQESYKNSYISARLLRYPIYRGQHHELAENFVRIYETSDDFVDNMDCELLYMSILFELGNRDQALQLVENLIANARKMQNKLKIVEGDLLKMRLLVETNSDKRVILNLLIEAITYAVENCIANPFWFERKSVVRVFNEFKIELKKELPAASFDFISRVLSADPQKGMSEKMEAKKRTDALTEREKEVLDELAEGSSNLQIAEKLCVSLATVKTHINNIYGKLEVNNRVAAVNKLKQETRRV